MKYFLSILLLFIFSCDTSDNTLEDEISPEIHIHQPQSTNMPAPGSIVDIDVHVTDNEELHDVDISITAENNADNVLMISFDHIHSTEFTIDTSFVADLHVGMMSNYTVEITAEDYSENITSTSVTFHVMDM